MRAVLVVSVILLCFATLLSAACDPSSAPHVNLKINEFSNAGSAGNSNRVNFLELSSDVSGQALTCFKLVAFDQNCEATAVIDLTAYSMSGNYFTITDSSSRFTSIFGTTAQLQNTGIATGTATAGGYRLVFAANSVTVGTTCAATGGELFDAVGWAAADGTAAAVFGGEGTEISAGLIPDAGGSLQRTQDTTDNAADFQHACQAATTPGAANPASIACPDVDLTPAQLTFNVAGVSQDITLTNTGAAPLAVSDISVTTDFTKSSDCPVPPMQLAAGNSCTISVTFIGSSATSGKLGIVDDTLAGFHNASLQAVPCVFCDDFEDGNVTIPLWTSRKSTWTVNGKGEAFAIVSSKGDLISPAFACGTCTFETTTQVTPGGRVSLFAWYGSGTNNVEIRLMQDKGKLFVKQKAGTLSVKQSVPATILANTFYTLKANYDGAFIHVLLNDVELVTLNPVAAPSGKAMFRVKSPSGVPVTGTYQGISVY